MTRRERAFEAIKRLSNNGYEVGDYATICAALQPVDFEEFKVAKGDEHKMGLTREGASIWNDCVDHIRDKEII